MFRQSATLLLLLAFMAQTFNKAAIVTSYFTNKAAYARNCENKAKPKMHCNGKCQMMKKLRQEEKKDQQQPERRSTNKDEVLSSKSFFATVPFLSTLSIIHFSNLTVLSLSDRAADFFHPPGPGLF